MGANLKAFGLVMSMTWFSVGTLLFVAEVERVAVDVRRIELDGGALGVLQVRPREPIRPSMLTGR
jgi:hypothetical protein